MAQSSDFGLDEWKSARDDLEKFDDRQQDLRKYGITFLSALIAADALTKTYEQLAQLRLAVIGITLVLIIATYLLDKNYDLIKEAIEIRARILEVKTNLELVQTVSDRSNTDKFDRYVLWVYVLFAGVSGIVGVSVLYPDVVLSSIPIILFVVVTIIIVKIHAIQPDLTSIVDWSFDRTICEKGEKVIITVTNLCPNMPVTFEKNKPIWEIHKEGEPNPVIPAVTAPKESGLTITACNNYSWELSTENLSPGIYRIYPYRIQEGELKGHRWAAPLRRAIIVSEPKGEKKSQAKSLFVIL